MSTTNTAPARWTRVRAGLHRLDALEVEHVPANGWELRSDGEWVQTFRTLSLAKDAAQHVTTAAYVPAPRPAGEPIRNSLRIDLAQFSDGGTCTACESPDHEVCPQVTACECCEANADSPWLVEHVTPRLVQQAVELVPADEVDAIVGDGGLSGASYDRLQRLIYTARGLAAAEFLQGA